VAIALTASLAFANSGNKALGQFDADDGTYAIETVTSVEACEALCKADNICRGTVVYQKDISKAEMQCRLNNGFGDNPAFPRTPPEPIDFAKALSDLNAYTMKISYATMSRNLVLPSSMNQQRPIRPIGQCWLQTLSTLMRPSWKNNPNVRKLSFH